MDEGISDVVQYLNTIPGCLDSVDIPKDQLNTIIHDVMHLDLPVTNEAKVVAISEVIQPRRRHK